MDKILCYFVACLYYIMRVFPIQKNKIVISSYAGLGYGDNGKYIVEELLRRNKAYRIIWLSKNKTDSFPQGVHPIRYKSIRSIYEQCTAKVWIDNRRKPRYVRKRKNQIYIMTWHGYMGIKRLEKDVEDKLGSVYVGEAKRDSKMIDYFVSGSRWETECIKRAFWYDGKILECGYPRSDILIHEGNKAKAKVTNYYKIGNEQKILLFAPTFRRIMNESRLDIYTLDWDDVLQALSNKFGGNWIGMIRLHPNLFALSDKLNIPSNIINATTYDDMQELIASCDCLITDYSSTVMDAGVANKIGFIHAVDYLDYLKDRDVYFDIKEDLPFAFSETSSELVNNINSFEYDTYRSKLTTFFDETYGVYRTGNASGYICDLIDASCL